VVVTAAPQNAPQTAASIPVTPASPVAPALLRTAAWGRLREAWRSLDEATSPGEGAPGTQEPQVKQAGRLAEQALDELQEAPAAAALDPVVLPALRSLVQTRVAVLTGLGFRLMVSHRMPSDSEFATAHVGAALEKRIDALLELRKAGAVSDEEYRLALDAVHARILALVALQSLDDRFGSGLDPMAETLQGLERSVAARRRAPDASADTALDELERGIAHARKLAPVLQAMIAELER
jgi:hypothetical protein